MHAPSGVELAGLAALLVAVPAVALLANSGRKHTGAARRAHLLLAAGGALSAGAALAGQLSALIDTSADHRATLGRALAITLAVGTTTLLTGTLQMPGAAERSGAALRHLIDGLVIAAALIFVAWVLLTPPTRTPGLPAIEPMILVSGSMVAVTAGLTTVLALHANRPRHVTVEVAAGVTIVAVASAGLSGGICARLPVVMLLGAILLPAGLVVVARAVKLADRPVQVTRDLIQRHTAYAFVPVLAMIGAAAYHLAEGGTLTTGGVITVSVEGLVLVSRQYLALSDVKRYTLALRQREAHFRELAHTDPLTGLANRRGLLRRSEGSAAVGGTGADQHRPGRLQERQRHARSRRR